MSQRIQVLLRQQVLELVKELSEETDLTLSKTVAQLVEEALEARGLYDSKYHRGKWKFKEEPKSMSDVIAEAVAQTGVRSQLVSRKTEQLDQTDLELLDKLKKLKALQEAGLI